MKTSKKISLIAGAIIILSTLGGFDGSVPEKARSGLQYEGDISVPGLSEEVTVYRDIRGVPHIYAADEKDLYLASGYISAQERLWQMDLIRRSATGHLSEIFGKSFVQTDLLMRSLNIEAKSEILIQNQDPLILECLQAYSDGVNEYILSGCSKFPVEFRILGYKPDLWRLEDIACIIGFMGWNLESRQPQTEIFNYRLVCRLGLEKAKQLIPDWGISNEVVYPEFKIGEGILNEAESFIKSWGKIENLGIVAASGSNNWAVSGKRSETGKPLLSNDMHLPFGVPGIWMQMHQVVPGKINVTGVMIPGQPFIIAGHNEKVAWGMTNLVADNIDLFAEKINPDDPDQYFINGEWRKMKIRDEIIRSRGGKTDTFSLRFTHRGPVISGFHNVTDATLSMRWAGNDMSDEIKAVYLLNRAECWNDFRAALTTFRTISQNFIFADTEGNIGLNSGGGIPIRKMNSNLIRNGETDELDWNGYVPFEQLPFSFNPEDGQVSSANNKTVSEDYPYYIGSNFFVPYRLNRIRNMLAAKEVHGIEDFKEMILDQHSELAAMITPFILKLNDRKAELSAKEMEALNELSGWDYEMKAELVAPTILEFFRISLRKNILSDELGDLYDKLDYIPGEYYVYRIFKTGADEWIDNINTPYKESLDDIILQSFREAVSGLAKHYGPHPEKWEWGKIHNIKFEHPLGSVRILNMFFHFNSDKYSIGGSDHTVSPFFGLSPEVNVLYGASERHIFNTANWDESYTVIPTGTSGIPSSEFYLSQTKAYIEGRFYKDAFSDAAVKSSIKYTLNLVPGNY